MKKILILTVSDVKGQPSYERVRAFINFYKCNNIDVLEKPCPLILKNKLALLIYIYKKNIKNILISMPPHRNFYLYLLPFVNIITDFRDGWSIAKKTGYGGTTKASSKINFLITRLVESFYINRSRLVITCTPGLKQYLEKITKSKILLITNGYSLENFHAVQNFKKKLNVVQKKKTGICVGKFSEYGNEKVKKILHKISAGNKTVTYIKLIGADKERNLWIYDWILEKKITNIKIEIYPRMKQDQIYKEILLSDFGITVIRDPSYEFGTKIFDYILCGIPVLNYFDKPNNFSKFFKEKFSNSKNIDKTVFIRERILHANCKKLLEALK